jgi:transposase
MQMISFLECPGLLAFIVTSKFADYLPLYRLEERQGFEISPATQSVWCGDVADVVEPLYQRMAELVRKSNVVATDDTTLPMLSPGQTHPARMWVTRRIPTTYSTLRWTGVATDRNSF